MTNEQEEAAIDGLGVAYKQCMRSIALLQPLHSSPEMCRYLSFSLGWRAPLFSGMQVAERLAACA